MLKIKQLLILISSLFLINTSYACNGLTTTVLSNSYIGNGEYLLTVEVCEFVSNSGGLPVDYAGLFGIILTVNG